MAPVAARMPHEMRAPSKAGPAAVEAQQIRSRLPTTISPFVPRSISAARRVALVQIVAGAGQDVAADKAAEAGQEDDLGRPGQRPAELVRPPVKGVGTGRLERVGGERGDV